MSFRIRNLKVLTEVYKVLQLLAEQSPTFGRSTVALSVQPLCDKLGDIKLRTAAGETLCLYAEKTAFGFVLNQGKCGIAWCSSTIAGPR